MTASNAGVEAQEGAPEAPAARETLLLIRLSAELTTKSRGTRKRFTRRLVENIRAAMRAQGDPARVESQWTRILVHASSPESAAVLARVPGISSFSIVEGRCPAVKEEILRMGTELFRDRVRGHTYAVRAKRAGLHPFSSFDIQKELGAALNPGAKVKLESPEVEVEVEVRDQWAFFFSGRVAGLGGLPLGVEGRAICLLSGGFDSAVAAWLLLKRGVEIDYVFCNLAGEAYERSVVQVAKVLADQWSYGSRPRLHVVEFGAPLDELRAKTQPKYWQLILKRLMYRAASRVATETRALAIITGESIGQVSSQTLANLGAIEEAVDLPVLRPLVGFDKGDIVDLTRRIGSYELSSHVKEYCAIAPGNPVTHANVRATAREEAKLELSVLDAATAARRVLELHRITAAEIVDSYLLISRIPTGAVVVDVRAESDWDAWHYPGAVRKEGWEIAATPSGLDPDGTYVLYCDAGVEAVTLAEQLQQRGVEAYAFRGGTRAIRKHTTAQMEGV
jgi:thiamine biosynthesis protein ThiI